MEFFDKKHAFSWNSKNITFVQVRHEKMYNVANKVLVQTNKQTNRERHA